MATPNEIILGASKKALHKTIAVSICILILFILLIVAFSKRISKPIIKISNHMNQIQKMNLDFKIKNDSRIKEINIAQNSLIALQAGMVSFKKYIPAKLVNMLIDNGQEAKIGGEEKELVIMFTDIKNFTTIAEEINPSELTIHLSDYFDHLVRIINKYEGTVDKYIGDAILVFWGAPNDVENPYSKASECAIEMQREIAKLNDNWRKTGKAIFETRIGLHCGKTLVGNIGSSERINYTIIGDTVNLAARLESINKQYGTKIIISDAVNQKIGKNFKTRLLDNIAVKGKCDSLKIFELQNYPQKDELRIKQFTKIFTKALNLYFAIKFNEALTLFNEANDIKPDIACELYIKRCIAFKINPPANDWDGVYRWEIK